MRQRTIKPLTAKIMKCKCAKLRVRQLGHREDKYFKGFAQLKTVDEGWRSILQCSSCDQLWLVDHYDKLQYLYAYKIDTVELPTEGSFFEMHKSELERLRNGNSAETCKFSSCSNLALNGLAYCAVCAIKERGIYE